MLSRREPFVVRPREIEIRATGLHKLAKMRLDLKTGTLNYENPETHETITVSRVVPTNLDSASKMVEDFQYWDWKFEPDDGSRESEKILWKARQLWEAECSTLGSYDKLQLALRIIKTQHPSKYTQLMKKSTGTR